MKIEIIEYWTDREKPMIISYSSMTKALHRLLSIHALAHLSKRRDELLPKAELILTMLEDES